MSRRANDDLKLIDVRPPALQALLAIPVIALVLLTWYSVRWNVGNTMAEYVPGLDESGIGTARMAVNLAPDDPLTHWTLATLLKNSLSPEVVAESLKEFEAAVCSSPNDYRYWLDLGIARSQAGDLPEAERALRQAVNLAPNYSYPRWYLGNLLLREGRVDDAFVELKKGAENDTDLRNQIFNVAIQVYGDDIGTITRAVGSAADVRLQLVNYLITRNRLDDASAVWSSLDADTKAREATTGNALITALAGAKRYKGAWDVYIQTLKDPSGLRPEQVQDGSFEQDLKEVSRSIFGWQIKSTPPQAQISYDSSVHHSGNRSLKIDFKAAKDLTFTNISQLLLVQPGTAYRLDFWVKTEDLKSAGMPAFQITDNGEGRVTGTSKPIEPGSNDWTPVTVEFRTGPKTEGVTLSSSRSACSDAICPIFGILWYDDFNLQRVAGNSGDAGSKRSQSEPAQSSGK
jgi:tetratricopeptide (TPR) repeat protein